MGLSVINLGIGLVLLMCINIVLGSIDSIFKQSFDKKKFTQGLLKSFIIALCTMGIYGVGYLNPDVIAMNINGQDVNLLTTIYILIMSGFVLYAKQCVEKLSKIILGEKALEDTKVRK